MAAPPLSRDALGALAEAAARRVVGRQGVALAFSALAAMVASGTMLVVAGVIMAAVLDPSLGAEEAAATALERPL